MANSKHDKHTRTRQFIDRWCDNLRSDQVDWQAASDPSKLYNCFGFAVGVLEWWQPPVEIDGVVANPTAYWPQGVPANTSIDAYIAAAKSLGFQETTDRGGESTDEVIVLYFTTKDREFQHAARQKSTGDWESKLGSMSDIAHTLDGIDNIYYGTGRVYMRRPRSAR